MVVAEVQREAAIVAQSQNSLLEAEQSHVPVVNGNSQVRWQTASVKRLGNVAAVDGSAERCDEYMKYDCEGSDHSSAVPFGRLCGRTTCGGARLHTTPLLGVFNL